MTSCPVTYIMFAFLPANAAGTVKLDYVRIYACSGDRCTSRCWVQQAHASTWDGPAWLCIEPPRPNPHRCQARRSTKLTVPENKPQGYPYYPGTNAFGNALGSSSHRR